MDQEKNRTRAPRLNIFTWGIRVGLAAILYALSWAFSYVLVNQDLNTMLMWQYFYLAWTFNAFVRPVFVQILSLGVWLLVLSFWIAVARSKRRSLRAH